MLDKNSWRPAPKISAWSLLRPIVFALVVASCGFAQTTWTPAGYSSWTTGASWSGGVPSSSLDAYVLTNGGIAGMLSISGVAKSVRVGGASGTAQIELYSSTLATSATSTIGYTTGGTGDINLYASTWNSGVDIVVGASGTGTMEIDAGSTVNDTFTQIATVAGVSGTVTLDGTGSKWVQSQGLVVGASGNGTFAITGGGAASNTDAHIGNLANSTGVVTVSGSGSSWTSAVGTSGQLYVGQAGQGDLTISSSGSVTVTGTGSGVTLGSSGAASGILSIGGGYNRTTGKALTATTAGTLTAGTVTGGAGTGTKLVNFDLTDASYTFSPVLAGALTVQNNGTGKTILAAANTYTGGTSVNAGTLVLNDLTKSPTFAIATGATLDLDAGTGVTHDYTVNTTFSGAGTLEKTGAGTAVWGVSVGTFNLGSGSLIDVEGGTFGGGSNANEVWTSNLSGLKVASGALFNGVEANVRVDALTGAGTISSGYTGGYSNFTFGVNNGSGTFSGVVQDTSGYNGNYVKTGTGTQIFSGTNTYSGTTTISGGTLSIANAAGLGSTAGGTSVSSGAALDINGVAVGAEPLTLNGTGISSAGALTGTGTAYFSGAVTLGSATSIGGTGSLTLTSSVSGNTLTKVGAGTLTLSGPVDDSNLAVVVSSGTLLLAKISSSSVHAIGGGATNNLIVNSGATAQLGGSGGDQIYTGAAVLVNGTFDLGGRSEGFDLLTGTGTVTNSASATTSTLTLGEAGSTQTLSTALLNGSGLTALNKAGAGTLTLSTAQTYTGGTTVTAGMLTLGASDRLADTGAVNVNGGTLNLSTFNDTVGAVTLTSGTISGTGTLTGTSYGVQSGTISAPLGGGSGVSLTKTTSGTVTINSVQSYTGGTTISAGTLTLGADNRLADGGALLVNGGTLDLGGHGDTVGAITLSSGAITDGSITGTSYSVQSGTISAGLGGSIGLTKTGSGTVNITTAPSYTGVTAVNGGTLAMSFYLPNSSAFTVASGATLSLTGNPYMTAPISGAGKLSIDGGGTTYIVSAASQTGGTAVNSGTLAVGYLEGTSGSLAGNISIATGATLLLNITNNPTMAGVISGAGGVNLNSEAKITLTGANTYTGGTVLQGDDTLSVGDGVTDGSITGNVSVGSLGYLNFDPAVSTSYGGTITLAGGGYVGQLTKSGPGKLILSGTVTGSDDNSGVVVINGGTLQLTDGSSMSVNIIYDNAALEFNNASAYSNSTYLTGGGTIIKNGMGELSLSGSGNFSGPTTLNAGTIDLASSNPLGTSGTVTINGGALRAGGQERALSNPTTVNASFGLGRFTDLNGAMTLNSDVTISAANSDGIANGNAQLNGVISGAHGLTVTGGTGWGTGALILGNSGNTFTGGVTLGSGGVVSVSDNGDFGGSAGLVTFNGGLLEIEGSFGTTGSARTVATSAGGGTIQADAAGSLGPVNGAGNLTKTGSAKLTLNGIGNLTGALTVSSGTLALGSSTAIGTGTVVIGSGATFDSSSFGFDLARLSGAGTATGSGVFSYSSASDLVFPTLLAGTASLSKSGGGNLTLSGTNTLSGNTTVSAGRLTLGNASALGSGFVIVNSGATLDTAAYGLDLFKLDGTSAGLVTGTSVYSYSNGALDPIATTLAGTASVSVTGGGTLTLTGTNTYSGGTTLSGGRLAISSDANLGNASGAVTLAGGTLRTTANLTSARTLSLSSGGSLSPDAGTTLVWNGPLTGAGGLTMAGAGALTLGGTNTGYSGLTTISSGTLTLGGTSALGSGTVSVSSGALLDTAGYGLDLTKLSGAGTATGTGSFGFNSSSNVTVPTTLSGSASLSKQGTGTLTLSGTNTYSGSTSINVGTLSIGGDANLGAGSLVLNGGTLGTTAGFTTTRALSLSGGGALSPASATTLVWNGPLSGSGGLTKSGAGSLTLGGSNGSYSGPTTVSTGTLTIGSANALGTGPVSVGSGATLDTAAFGLDLSTLSGAGTATGTGVFGYNSASDFSLATSLVGTASVAKAGAGNLTLSGANSYSGGTSISNNGTLTLGNAGALGSGAVTVGSGATLDTAAFGLDLSRLSGAGTAKGTGTFTDNSASDFSLATILAGTAGLTKSGASNLTLSGANTYSGTTTLSGGRITLGSAAGAGAGPVSVGAGTTLDTASFGLDLSRLSGAGAVTGTGSFFYNSSSGYTLATPLSGTASVSKTGTGSLTLSGANNYSGGTSVNNGTLVLGSSGALGSGGVAVGATGTLNVGSLGFDLTRLSGAGTATGTGIFTFASATDESVATILAGTGSLSKSGTGDLTLSGTNTYSGGTSLTAGTLTLGNVSALGSGAVAIGTGTILDTGSYGLDLTHLSGAGTATGTGVFSYNSASNYTLATPLSGTASLAKAGTGNLTIPGANTYSGGTSVTGGTLTMGNAGALGTSAIAVGSGATLDAGALGFDLSRLSGTGSLTGTGVFGYNSSSDYALPTALKGTASLSKSGTGTLTLTGSNAFSGGTTITAGLINFNSLAAFDYQSVTLNGGGIQWSPGNTSDPSSILAPFGANGAVLDTNGNDVFLYSSALTGSGSLTKNGAGTLTLYRDSTYTGGTLVNGGTLATYYNAGSILGDVTLANGAIFQLGGSKNSFPGLISGNGSLVIYSPGMTLTAHETYTGSTTLSAGTLTLGGNDILPDTTLIALNGGSLDLAGYSDTVGALSGTGNVSIGTGTLTIAENSNTDPAYPGTFTGSGNLVKSGTGTLTLTNGYPAFTGTTTVSSGKLVSASGSLAGPISISAGALLDLGSTGYDLAKISGAGTATSTNGFQYTSGADYALSTSLAGTGNLTKYSGGGNLTLNGVSTYTGYTSVQAGSLTFGVDNAIVNSAVSVNYSSSTLNLAGHAEAFASLYAFGTLAFGTGGKLTINSSAVDSNFNGVFTGSGDVVKNGTRGFSLSLSSGMTGNVIVNGGSLNLYMSGGYSGNVTVNGGSASLSANVANGVTLLTVASGASASLQTYPNNFDLGRLSGAGTVSDDDNFIYSPDANSTLQTILSGSAGLIKNGAGILTMGVSGSYTGGTTVNTGTLALGSGVTLPAASYIQIQPGATIDAGANNFDLSRMNGGGGTLTGSGIFSAPAYAYVYDQIAGTASVVKSGVGTTTYFTNHDSYSGGTTVNSGILQLNYSDSAGTGPISVATGATLAVSDSFDLSQLSGTGTLNGSGTLTYSAAVDKTINLTVNAYGAVNKSGPATLTFAGSGDSFGSDISVSGGTLAINAPLNQYSRFSITNGATLDLGGASSSLYFGLGTAGSPIHGSLLNGTITPTNSQIYWASGTITATFAGSGGADRLWIGGDPLGTVVLNGTDNLVYSDHNAVIIGNSMTGAAGTVKVGNANALTAASENTQLFTGTLDLNGVSGVRGNSIAFQSAGLGYLINGNTSSPASFGGGVSLANGLNYLGGDGSLTLSGVVSGSGGSLNKMGGGTLTLSGTNTYGGGTVVSAGTLRAGANGAIPNGGPVTVNSGGTFDLGGFATTFGSLSGVGAVSLGSAILTTGGNNLDSTFSGVISGPGSLVKEGGGNFTLSGANAYTGGTTVNSGTLTLGASGSLADTGDLTVSGGTFDLGAFDQTVSLVTLNSGLITGTTGTLTGSAFNVLAGSADARLASAGTLTKSGSDTVTLLGANSFGAVAVNGGELVLGSSGALGSTGPISFAGGALQFTAANTTDYSGRLSTADNQAFAFDTNGQAVALASDLASHGGSLTKLGVGTLTVSGANTYDGGTVLNAGTLALGSNGALGTTGTLTFGGGALQFSAANTNDYSSRFSSAAGQSFQLDTNGQTVTLATRFTSDGGTLTKLGDGTLILGASSTWTGDTIVSAGTLALGAANALTGTGSLEIDAPGSFDLAGSDASVGHLSGDGAISLGAATLTAGDATDSTFSGAISGLGGKLIKTGTDTLTLGGTNPYTGGTEITSGAILATTSDNLGSGSVVVDSGAALIVDSTNSPTIANVLSGDGSLTGQGNSGTLTLSGANTYTGGTQIGGGTLALASVGALGSTGTLTFIGGTLQFSAANTTDYSGRFDSAPYQTFSFDTNGQSVRFGTPFASTYGSLSKFGTGTLTLGVASTWTGDTTIHGGTLALGATNALTGTGALEIDSPGIFDLGGFTASVGHLFGDGTIALGTSTLTAGDDYQDGYFSGSITGSGKLIKAGGATLYLSGASTYSGGTEITVGAINASASQSLGTGGVVIDQNTTLIVDSTNSPTIANDLSGTGTLTLQGVSNSYYPPPSVLDITTLTGTNSFTGGTYLNSGYVSFTDAASFGTGSLFFQGGFLQWAAGNTADISSRLDSSGRMAFDTNGNNVTLAGNFTNDSLVKAGAGTLTLTGQVSSSPYTESDIEGGTLAIAQGGSLSQPINTLYVGANGLTGAMTVAGLNSSVTEDQLKVGNGGAGSASISDQGSVVVNTLVLGPDYLDSYDPAYSGTITVDGAGSSLTTLYDSNVQMGTLSVTGGATFTGDGNLSMGDVFDYDNYEHVATDASVSVSGANSSASVGGDLTLFATDGHGVSVSAGGSVAITGNINFYGGVIDIGGARGAAALTPGTLTAGTIYGLDSGNPVNGSRIVNFNHTDSAYVFAPAMTGDLSVEQNGPGTTILTTDDDYTGGTTINAGALQLGNGGTSGLIQGDIVDQGTLVFDRSDDVTSTGNISGTGTLTHAGSGRLTLAGSVNYTGTTTITTGTLELAIIADSALPGKIIGGGSLVKSGTGTLVLSGANSYAGTTDILGGALEFAKPASFYNGDDTKWTADNLVVSPGATAAFGVDETHGFTAANIDALATLASTNGGFQDGSAIGFDTSTAGTFTYGSDLGNPNGGANSLGVAKLGTGTLVLTGNNTYTGGTTLTAGALALGSAGAIGSTGTISFAGGALQFTAANTTDYSPRFSTAAGQRYALDTNGQSATIATPLTSAGGTLTKLGNGTLTVTAENTYSGGTTISGGTLQIGNGGTTGSVTGPITDNGNLVFNHSDDIQYKAEISGTGGLTQAGTGTLTLSSTETYSGPTTISSGTLLVGKSSLPTALDGASLVLQAGQGVTSSSGGQVTGWADSSGNGNDATFGGGGVTDAGAAGLAFDGSGFLNDPLSGSDSAYTFFAVINPTITYNNRTLFGSSVDGNIQFRVSDSSLQFLSQNQYVVSSSNSSVGAGTSQMVVGAIASGAQSYYIGNGAAQNFTGSYSANGGATLLIGAHGGNTENFVGDITSLIAFTSVLTPTQIAAVQAYLNYKYFGGPSSGVNFASAELSSLSPVNITASGAALDLDDSVQTVASLAGVAGSRVYLGSGSLTTGGDGTNTAFAGTLSDGGGVSSAIGGRLTKVGAGTLTLTGANTYTGGTSITGGKLVANNLSGSATGPGLVTIKAGGTLGGSGTVGPISIENGGTISPGNSPGTLTTGDETWSGGGTYVWQLNDATGAQGSAYDWLNSGGTITITSTIGNPFIIAINSLTMSNLSGNAANFDPGMNYSWVIASAANGVGGFSADKFAVDSSAFFNAPGSTRFTITNVGDDLVLNYTAVPEPGAWGAVVGFGLFALALVRRRTR